jgi:hypothetical protein
MDPSPTLLYWAGSARAISLISPSQTILSQEQDWRSTLPR